MAKKKAKAKAPKKKAPKKKARKKKTAAIDYITPDLRPLADPRNARSHDEANVKSIATSLTTFGQLKPIVVNRRGSVIEAGNGTLAAALSLGWTHLAVVWVEHDRATQTGFAIADNRTAELAEWDDTILDELLAVVQADSPELYDDLLLDHLRTDDAPAPGSPEGDTTVPSCQVVVECADSDDQKRVFDRLRKQGYTCFACQREEFTTRADHG